MNRSWNRFIPKSIVCLREGLSRRSVLSDLVAGVTVGLIVRFLRKS
jgi:hypothetical protein